MKKRKCNKKESKKNFHVKKLDINMFIKVLLIQLNQYYGISSNSLLNSNISYFLFLFFKHLCPEGKFESILELFNIFIHKQFYIKLSYRIAKWNVLAKQWNKNVVALCITCHDCTNIQKFALEPISIATIHCAFRLNVEKTTNIIVHALLHAIHCSIQENFRQHHLCHHF